MYVFCVRKPFMIIIRDTTSLITPISMPILINLPYANQPFLIYHLQPIFSSTPSQKPSPIRSCSIINVRTFPTDDFFKFHSQKVHFSLRPTWDWTRHCSLCLDILETMRPLCLVFCRAARSLSNGPPRIQVDWQKWCWQWRRVGFVSFWLNKRFLERCPLRKMWGRSVVKVKIEWAFGHYSWSGRRGARMTLHNPMVGIDSSVTIVYWRQWKYSIYSLYSMRKPF